MRTRDDSMFDHVIPLCDPKWASTENLPKTGMRCKSQCFHGHFFTNVGTWDDKRMCHFAQK